MMRVWSHQPKFLHLGLFIVAYVLGCGFAQLLAIVPGTGISIWAPSGLFIATLVLASRQSWLWWVAAGCLAELIGNFLWFHSPLPAALLIYSGNALEAMVGAWLVNRTCGRPVRLETLREVLAFIISAAGIAPVFSATVGSATLAWFDMQSQTFAAAWPLFWIGDATGVLIVAPLAVVVFQNWRGKAELSGTRWMEASVLGLIFLAVAGLSLSGYLPFAYIIMPPLLWAAVRFEFKGAAVTLTLLALITAIFTVSGASQFAGDPESQKQKQVMLHLFLAISAFSALIVATISRQYQQAMLTLRQSEQRLQQMIDAVPVRIWSVTPAGGPIYFNKRYQDYFRSVIPNFEAIEEPRIEEFVKELIHPEHAPGVLGTLRNCFESGRGSVMRFRWRENDGVYRWAECRVEPRRDQDGAIAQWYGVSIDIDDEVRAQEALLRASEKLALAAQAASLAELSASIAHEVNQPLAAIVANAQACHRWLSTEPPNIERAKITAERITRDANSATDVISHIRALFRHAPYARSPEDVNRLIIEVCRLMADKITAKRIRIETGLDPNLPSVVLDRVQVQQVLVNLIRNGIEAMDAAVDDTRVLQIRSCRDGPDAIRVEVCDAGTGFENADRALEPFFTTKKNGMGMGLAISRSIIESHGGRLGMANNETHGATVGFTLPLASEIPIPIAASHHGVDGDPGAGRSAEAATDDHGKPQAAVVT